MKLFVVRCFMEGCEECGDVYHIVGVFSSRKQAENAQSVHRKYKHLHSFVCIDIDEVTLDEYRFSYGEGQPDYIKKD